MREVTPANPALALIRLQWWREVVEGAPRSHEVATPLTVALAAGEIQPGPLLHMIEARETEAEAEFSTLAAWSAWLERGAGSLAVAAAQVLGAPVDALARMRNLGAGTGLAGQLRNLPALAGAGRCLLPMDVLAEHGLSPDSVVAGVPPGALLPVRGKLVPVGLAMLGEPRACPREWVAAGLTAVLARRDLRRTCPPARQRGIADRSAVMQAAWRARC